MSMLFLQVSLSLLATCLFHVEFVLCMDGKKVFITSLGLSGMFLEAGSIYP